MLEMLRRMDPEQVELDLYVLTGQGELVGELPAYVRLLNREYADCSVWSPRGRRRLARTATKALLHRGEVLRSLPYLCGNLVRMLMRGKLCPDKLLWRALADSGQQMDQVYDLAVAYLEGGSAYYVADYVKARKKAAFVHVDYRQAGYTRALDQDCYLGFDRIFAVSGEVRDVFVSVYPECAERTVVFPTLLDRERIVKMSKAEGGFVDAGSVGDLADRQSGDLAENDGGSLSEKDRRFRILSVGRLTAQKAYEVSIEAMRLLKAQGVRARWYVLGEGDERARLERLIGRYGLSEEFILLGTVSNPYPYMRQADIYVHASRFEGRSMAVREAGVLGKPILLSDCSGNREQVEDGIDGLMCAFTPQAVCDGILRLIRDDALRTRLGQAAAERNRREQEELSPFYELLYEECK